VRNILFDTTFLLLLTASFALQTPDTIRFSYLIAFFYFCFSRIYIRKNYFFVWAITTSIFMMAALNKSFGFTPFFYLIGAPFLILAALKFSSRPLIQVLKALQLYYWIFITAIFFGIFTNWDSHEPLEGLIPGSSTNALPSYLIVIQIAYSLSFYLKNKRLPITSPIATLVIAIFGLGRGSMIVAVLILSFSILVNLLVSKSDRKILLYLAGIFSPLAAFYFYANSPNIFFIIEQFFDASKFSSGVLDEHRGYMIADYLNKIDIGTFIIGADYTGTSIDKYYGGNPHNSFIRMHSFYGILGLVLIFIPLYLIVASNKVNSSKIITFSLISFALLRATSEPIFFPSVLDFFYFLYLFIYFRFAAQWRPKKTSFISESVLKAINR